MTPASVRKVAPRSLTEIGSEWDLLAETRHEQETSGRDISFNHVLAPALTALVKREAPASVVDIGCGPGVFTNQLVDFCPAVTGIDISESSIALARTSFPQPTFVHSSVEKFAAGGDRYTCAVANMTFMTVPDLATAIDSTAKLLVNGSLLVFTVTHPCNWPRYWRYESADWFDCNAETFIEARFSISAETTEYTSTHVHRPLDLYVSSLRSAVSPSSTCSNQHPLKLRAACTQTSGTTHDSS